MAAPKLIYPERPPSAFGGLGIRAGYRSGDGALNAIMQSRPQRNNDDLMMMLFTLLSQQKERGFTREQDVLDREQRQSQFKDDLLLRRNQFEESQAAGSQQRDLMDELLREQRFGSALGVGKEEFGVGRQDAIAQRERELASTEFLFSRDFDRGKQVSRAPMRRLTRAFDKLATADEVTPTLAGKLEDAFLSARDKLGVAVGAGSRLTRDEGLSQGEFLGLTNDLGLLMEEITLFGEDSDDQTRRRMASLLATVESQQDQLLDIGDRFPDDPTLRGVLGAGEFQSQLSGIGREQQTARRTARQAFEEGDVVSEITSLLGGQREGALQSLTELGTFAPQLPIGQDLSLDIFELLQGKLPDRAGFGDSSSGLAAELERLQSGRSELREPLADAAVETRQAERLRPQIESQRKRLVAEKALVQEMSARGASSDEILKELRRLGHKKSVEETLRDNPELRRLYYEKAR